MKTIATLLTGAAAACGLASSAGAVVNFTSSSATNGTNAIDPGFGSQTLIYDFDTVSPGPGALTGSFAIATAPGTAGVTAAPSGTPNGGRYLTVPFPTTPGQATLSLGGAYSAVSFYWGSIDPNGWNTLNVLGAGGAVIRTVHGEDVAVPAASGDQTGQGTNRRVFFTATGGDVITGFRFNANQFAFETDTFAGVSAVPEPSTWGMMLLGFGLVGAGARRRRRLVSSPA